MHLCAELIAVSMMLEPLGEIGANFSLQLSSQTQFTEINNKKVIAENQCEKHKKSSLGDFKKKQTVLFRASQLVSLKNNLKIKNKHKFNTVIYLQLTLS